jgi:hypothetical protein
MNIKKFIINTSTESNNTLKVFSQQVIMENEGSGGVGSFFGFMELGHPGQDFFINHAISVLNEIFSETLQSHDKKRFDDSFEDALQRLNKKLTEFIQEKNILINFETLSGAIVVVIGQNIYFSYLGKVASLMIHKTGKDSYKIINILENVSGSAIKPTVFKVFSNIISGQVGSGDYLFFAPINILSKIDNEEIKDFVVGESVDGIVKKLDKYFANKTSDKALGGIIVDMNGNAEVLSKKIHKEVEQEIKKAEEEIEKEIEEVEDIIEEDDVIEDVDEDINEIVRNKEINKNKVIEEAEAEAEDEEIIDEEIEDEYIIPNQAKEASEANEANFEANEADNGVHKPKKINMFMGKKSQQTKKSFFSIKKLSYFLLLVAIVMAIFFSQSLWEQKGEQNNKRQELLDIENSKKIEDLMAKIESLMIIKKDDEALENIKKAQTLFAGLSDPKSEKIISLEKKLETFLNSLRKITEIAESKVLAELVNPVEHLILEKGAIYLYNSENSLYKITLSDGSVKAVAINIEDKGSWQKNVPDFEVGKTLLFYNGTGLSQYDFTTNELSTVAININSKAVIDDLFFYGQKLYLVDSKNNQIYKYAKQTKNSFGTSTDWLTGEVEFDEAVSMAIDSNIWVMQKDGKLLKFYKGEKQDFQLDTIDPVLSAPTKIYTALELDKIFILEPANKRLVIFNKQGKLLAQYMSEKFDKLSDFVIAKDDKGVFSGVVYLLNTNEVFEINVGK